MLKVECQKPLALEVINVDGNFGLTDAQKLGVPPVSLSVHIALVIHSEFFWPNIRDWATKNDSTHFTRFRNANKSAHGLYRVNQVNFLHRCYVQMWKARRKCLIFRYRQRFCTSSSTVGLLALCWKLQCSLPVLCSTSALRRLWSSRSLRMRNGFLSLRISY